MEKVLPLIGRSSPLFSSDIKAHETLLDEVVSSSRFLVLGGAGTIGQAVTIELFKRNPKKLHVVDISENNLVELVRDLRSSLGYINGDFQTFSLDIGSLEYEAFIKSDGKYDYVLNLSALKHVRSEKNPYTLMRMININILNTIKTLKISKDCGVKKYFCVSTDKAANPVNMMGASKRIMEMFLMKESNDISISTARFANVAFSDGSLLHGFHQRIKKMQPIVAPDDVRRYFITGQESGELCLMSCIFGENRNIFFPKLSPSFRSYSFSEIALNYIKSLGYEPFICESEEEARENLPSLIQKKMWPLLFSKSDTTGEKIIEEFFTSTEKINLERFKNIGVIDNQQIYDNDLLENFIIEVEKLKSNLDWSKEQIIELFFQLIPEFSFEEKGKYLDGKM